MPFVWSIGTIIGPAIGGCFANPSENFPKVFSPHGLFGRFPYLLPNLICAALLLVAIIVGLFLIEETHPDKQPWSQQVVRARRESTAQTPLFATAGSTAHAHADLTHESYGTFNAVNGHQEQSITVRPSGRPTMRRADTQYSPISTIFSRRVLMLVTALGIFTYHSMTYDNLLPIFLQDSREGDDLSTLSTSDVLAGGIGLSTQQVGIIMAVNGLIALFIQGVIFPLAATWLGVWKLFVVVTCAHPVAYFIVPYLAFLPRDALYPGIYAALTIRNLLSILAYPVLLILIKEASPGPSYLGRINGLAASVGAACRTLASPISGALYGVGIRIHFTPLSWWISALVAVMGALQLLFIRRRKYQSQVNNIGHFHEQEQAMVQDDSETVYYDIRPNEDSTDDEAAPIRVGRDRGNINS